MTAGRSNAVRMQGRAGTKAISYQLFVLSCVSILTEMNLQGWSSGFVSLKRRLPHQAMPMVEAKQG